MMYEVCFRRRKIRFSGHGLHCRSRSTDHRLLGVGSEAMTKTSASLVMTKCPAKHPAESTFSLLWNSGPSLERAPHFACPGQGDRLRISDHRRCTLPT